MSRNSLRAKKLLIFLLMFGMFSKCCHSETSTEDRAAAPEEQEGDDSSAFFALRSCHQVMFGDSGEFFSPDYLCSNPPLWCNWTIHVDAGKRVHLYLEDLSPDDACRLKQDQIHLDEPAGSSGGHKVLERCWHEAKYISISNTLYVVLLIGGHPGTPYRGFYGRYQAFGPPIVYNPPNDSMQHDGMLWFDSDVKEPSLSQKVFTEPNMDAQQIKTVLPEQPTKTPPASHDPMYDYFDDPSLVSDELPWTAEEPDETSSEGTVPPAQDKEDSVQVGRGHLQDPSLSGQRENYSNMSNYTPAPTTMIPVNAKTSRSGGVAARDPLQHEGTTDHQKEEDSEPPLHVSAAVHRDINEPLEEHMTSVPADDDPPQTLSDMDTSQGSGSAGGNETVKRHNEASRRDPVPPESIPAHSSMVEPLSDHRRNGHTKNHSDLPHLPGDNLFEVAVELNFQQDSEEPWDLKAKSLLVSVKKLIGKQLGTLHAPKSVSSKRIKRLSAGVLYILWLQISGGPGGSQVHRALHASLQGLIETAVSLGDNHRNAVIVSLSTADVNECGTHLVLCDINAECVNQFGTYTCHCRPGFQDMSRLGSGGTLCVDVDGSIGCDPGDFAQLTKGVYVLFFLLSSLLLTILLAVGVVYFCRRRGSFMVPCCSNHLASRYCDSVHDGHSGDHSSFPANSELPPPPPPIRRPREGWSHQKDCCPAVDLPLLRFSPILPLDAFKEREEVGKK